MKRKWMALVMAVSVFASSIGGNVLIGQASDEIIVEDGAEEIVQAPEFAEEDAVIEGQIIEEDQVTAEDQAIVEDQVTVEEQTLPEETLVEEEAAPDDGDLTIEDIVVVEEEEIPEELKDDTTLVNESSDSEAAQATLSGNVVTGTALTVTDSAYGISTLATGEIIPVVFTATFQQTRARTMLDLVNNFRTGDDAWEYDEDGNKVYHENLSELTYDYDLEEVAMQRAAELVLRFAHYRPNGDLYSLKQFPYTYLNTYGENISLGSGSSGSAESIFDGWKEEDEPFDEQGHRRNMLNEDFTSIGVGCVYYNGIYYWVQEFAKSDNVSSETVANDSATDVSIDVSTSLITSSTVDYDPQEYNLAVNDSADLPALTTKVQLSGTYPESKIPVTVEPSWEIEDTSIAEISDGQIIAKTVGSTSLTASVLGESLEIPITVASSITACDIVLDPETCTYTGEEQKPTVTVMDGTTTLAEGTDYTVSYDNNTEVGVATVTVTGAGSYSGEVTVNFTINPASISGAVITFPDEKYVYYGGAQEPEVTVTVNGTKLTADTDYTVAYSNNVNAGTATVTVTGTGNYVDTATATFTIEPADISAASVAFSQDSYTYDGSAKTPDATVKVDGIELTADTDYTITYSENVNVGTAAVTIKGEGNYTGSVEGSFAIVRASIADATVTVDPDEYTYDGSEQKPDVTVTMNGTELTEGTDYTVSYSDNIDAGEAAVTVTGMGNYEGTVDATFTINPADLTDAVVMVDPDTCTYDGSGQTPDVTVTVNGTKLTADTDYTVAYSDNVNAGDATVTVTGMGNYTGEATATFTIEPADISDASVTFSPDSYTYDGSEKTPDATVTVDGRELTADTDYTITYSNNVNVGTAAVTITGKGNYTGTVEGSFDIVRASIADATVAVDPDEYTYDGSERTPDVTVTMNGTKLTEGTDYTVSYSDNIDAGTATVTVTGMGNYEGTVSATFTISPADLADADVMVDPDTCTYDGSGQTPDVTVTVNGTKLTAGTDYTVVYSDNIDAGDATVTVTGMGNYTGEATATFTIEPADISAASVTFSPDSYTYDGSEQTPDATVTVDGIELTANTDYTIDYTDNVNVGTAVVTITGMGNYTGTVEGSFDIVQASIADATVAVDPDTYIYDGEEKKPSVTVTAADGTVLTEFEDYTVAYSDNIDVGTGTVTITGIGNYTGTATGTFEIKQEITADMFTVDTDAEIYTGSEITKEITSDLTEDEDYTVSYADNTDAGTATITITGIGSYIGELTYTFEIEPADITDATVELSEDEYTYDGKEKTPTATVTLADGTVLTENTDYTVSYENNIEAGTATVTVTGIGNYTGTAAATFTIDPAPETETEPPQTETSAPQTETEPPQTETSAPQTETEQPQTETEQPQTDKPSATTTTALLMLKGTASRKTISLSWNKVQNADGYIVYGKQCGKKLKKLATIEGRKNTTWKITGLKQATRYKFKVYAYKTINGKAKTLKKSNMVHLVTTGSKYTNIKSVKVSEKAVSLRVGRSRKVTATYTLLDSKKRLVRHMGKIRYASSDKSVAVVNAKGKITAVGKGTCTVYAYAPNGSRKKITVTVK